MQPATYPKAYLYRRIVQAKLFIDAHYAENIDLHNIAGEAFFSRFHFTREFKKIYGKTPHQYLIKLRIEKASRLLQTTISVSDVCYAVGFESLGSFSALFKRLTGLAPSVYLLQQQKRRDAIVTTPLHFIPGCFSKKKTGKKKSNFEEMT